MAKANLNLEAAEVKALAALVTDTAAKKASAELVVGENPVDFTVRVHGVLNRGKDYEQEIVSKADPWTLLVVALSHLNGVTVESITKEALTADPALVENLKVQAKKAIETVKGPTLTPCNGKVTVDLVCERV
jgi:hypothetical protein